MPSRPWQAEVYAALKSAGVRQIGYVPDAGHAHLIEAAHADPDVRAVVLTTEEEGIGAGVGGRVGGRGAGLCVETLCGGK
jgi:sulfopyruvate decarboxylase TPP-binding subunit